MTILSPQLVHVTTLPGQMYFQTFIVFSHFSSFFLHLGPFFVFFLICKHNSAVYWMIPRRTRNSLSRISLLLDAFKCLRKHSISILQPYYKLSLDRNISYFVFLTQNNLFINVISTSSNNQPVVL